MPPIVFPKGGKSPQCTRFSFKKMVRSTLSLGFMRVFFVISQSNRFIVNQEDDTLDILNVMGPSVSNYFFLRELKNLFSVPSVFLRSNALFLDPSTNLSESTCELSRENLPVIPPRSFPTGSPSYPSRETFPISPRAPLSAQPPAPPAPPVKPHLTYHGHAATLRWDGTPHRPPVRSPSHLSRNNARTFPWLYSHHSLVSRRATMRKRKRPYICINP